MKKAKQRQKKQFVLAPRDCDLLYYALGLAMGTAMKQGMPEQAKRIHKLFNKIKTQAQAPGN